MHRIAIIHEPSSTHALTWKMWLESAEYSVERIYDDDSFNHSKDLTYDLVVPLITISDYVTKDNARMRALLYFSSKDTKLLTSLNAIAASSDKLKTADILRSNSLPHPWTDMAENLVWDTSQAKSFIVKPRFGHSGNDIHLVQNEEEFNTYKDSNMLAQRYIEHAECIRIIASHSEILSAYKKIPPKGEIIANIEKGAKRQTIVPTYEMKKLALSAV